MLNFFRRKAPLSDFEAVLAKAQQVRDDAGAALAKARAARDSAAAIKLSYDREGHTLVSNEVAGFVAFLVSSGAANGWIGNDEIQQALRNFGLAVEVPYDPETHGRFPAEPGEPILVYALPLLHALGVGRQHMAPLREAMN